MQESDGHSDRDRRDRHGAACLHNDSCQQGTDTSLYFNSVLSSGGCSICEDWPFTGANEACKMLGS